MARAGAGRHLARPAPPRDVGDHCAHARPRAVTSARLRRNSGSGSSTDALIGHRELGEALDGVVDVLVGAHREGVEAAALHEVELVAQHVADGAELAVPVVTGAQQVGRRESRGHRGTPGNRRRPASTRSKSASASPGSSSGASHTPVMALSRRASSAACAFHTDSGNSTASVPCAAAATRASSSGSVSVRAQHGPVVLDDHGAEVGGVALQLNNLCHVQSLRGRQAGALFALLVGVHAFLERGDADAGERVDEALVLVRGSRRRFR